MSRPGGPAYPTAIERCHRSARATRTMSPAPSRTHVHSTTRTSPPVYAEQAADTAATDSYANLTGRCRYVIAADRAHRIPIALAEVVQMARQHRSRERCNDSALARNSLQRITRFCGCIAGEELRHRDPGSRGGTRARRRELAYEFVRGGTGRRRGLEVLANSLESKASRRYKYGHTTSSGQRSLKSSRPSGRCRTDARQSYRNGSCRRYVKRKTAGREGRAIRVKPAGRSVTGKKIGALRGG
jgi:hypothetical protein